MIRLIENYVIQPGAMDYMLAKDTGRVDKKTGTPDLKPISYHYTVQKAIQAALDDYTRKSLAEGDKDLREALSVIRACEKRFEDLLKEAMG